MNFDIGPIVLILMFLIAGGCSSLLPEQKADKSLSAFFDQPKRYALYNPASLKSEEKLKVFGWEDYGRKFTQQFQLQDPLKGVMERFLEAMPILAGIIILSPEEARDLALGPEEQVLFFHSDWRLLYRRITPNFSMNQLQMGVVAKIIPLGQVLNGKGTLALRTAAWEGNCSLEAFGGKFYHLNDWAADNGALLRHGIQDAQNYCGQKLAQEFSETVLSRKGFRAR